MGSLLRRRRDRFELKTPEQFRAMRRAGLVVGQTLERLRIEAAPGVTTGDLDRIARECLAKAGATSSFLGYARPPFPAVICASVNDEVVHGIPGERALVDGDLLKVDFGAIVDGWHGDAAITIPIGTVAPDVLAMSEATRLSLAAGLRAVVPGARLGDVSHAIESEVLRLQPAPDAYGILEDYGGHGIGSAMHMEPHVLNYGDPGKGPELVEGMALAIEPMLILGSPDVRTLADDWTVASADGGLASHWEHTIALTADGPWVTTAIDGGLEILGHSVPSD